jgi:hypothetical protein
VGTCERGDEPSGSGATELTTRHSSPTISTLSADSSSLFYLLVLHYLYAFGILIKLLLLLLRLI